MRRTRLPLSNYVLLAANFVPLVGVLFYDWNLILVLALFWIENLIIGFFNLSKMVVLGVFRRDLHAIFLCGFFIIHYGAFCSAHGLLLSDILNFPVMSVEQAFGFQFDNLANLFLSAAAVCLSFIQAFSPMIYLGLTALVLSHLVSFIENFVLRGEIFKLKVDQLLMRPYSQIIVMHIGLLFGALAFQHLGSPIWLLVTIVLAKITVDYKLFNKRRNALMTGSGRNAES